MHKNLKRNIGQKMTHIKRQENNLKCRIVYVTHRYGVSAQVN